MDIGTEIERIIVEPLEDPVPHEQPTPTETPDTEIIPNREPAHANLLTPPPRRREQVAALVARPLHEIGIR